MASENAYDAMKTFLTTEFGGTYSILDWEQIEVHLQQQTNPFMALDGGSGTASLESIGTPTNNRSRDEGAMVLHIFVPSNGSLASARSIAAQVRSATQYQRLPVPAGETMRVTNIDPPSSGVIHDGLWHSMMLPITYDHRYVVNTTME